jgi:hypothetical protein
MVWHIYPHELQLDNVSTATTDKQETLIFERVAPPGGKLLKAQVVGFTK